MRDPQLEAAYQQWITDGRPGNPTPRGLMSLFAPTKRPGWPDGSHGVQPDGRWNHISSHVGNRAERRAAAARKRRAK